MRVGISFVDDAGAAGNLAAEIDHFDFERVRTDAAQVWRDALSVVELDGATERDGVMVATSLYPSTIWISTAPATQTFGIMNRFWMRTSKA